MKPPILALSVAACLLIPAITTIRLRKTDAYRPETVLKAFSTPADAVPPASEPVKEKLSEDMRALVTQFSAGIVQWELSRNPESDQLEAVLRDMITDENAAVILQSLPDRFQGSYLGNLMIERWARQDRLSAIQWLAAQREQTHFQIANAVRGWGSDDNALLLGYVDTLATSSWKDRVAAAITQDCLQNNDPELALLMAIAQRPSQDRTRLMQEAVLKWSVTDPQSAIEQVREIKDLELQNALIPYVAIGYATLAPEDAANWLVASAPTGDPLQFGVGGVIQTWVSQHQPTQAAKWVEKLPPGRLHEYAFQELIRAWRDRNREEAKQWIAKLPEGPSRAVAYAELKSAQ